LPSSFVESRRIKSNPNPISACNQDKKQFPAASGRGAPQWKPIQQIIQPHPLRLPPVKDRLDDIRREQPGSTRFI
jgi:hypothetical protein